MVQIFVLRHQAPILNTPTSLATSRSSISNYLLCRFGSHFLARFKMSMKTQTRRADDDVISRISASLQNAQRGASSDNSVMAIPHCDSFPKGKVPAHIRCRIGQALHNRECTVKFFIVRKGYSKQRLSDWKQQFNLRGASSFVRVGAPVSMDEIATKSFQADVLASATVAKYGAYLPGGMTKAEAEAKALQYRRESYERRTGMLYLMFLFKNN